MQDLVEPIVFRGESEECCYVATAYRCRQNATSRRCCKGASSHMTSPKGYRYVQRIPSVFFFISKRIFLYTRFCFPNETVSYLISQQ